MISLKMNFIKFLVLITSLFISLESHSKPVELKSIKELSNYTNSFKCFEDTNTISLPFESIQSKDFIEPPHSFGYTESNIWYKVELKTDQDDLYILISPEWLNKVTCYIEQSDSNVKVLDGGTTIPRRAQELPLAKHSFKLQKGTFTYFFEFHGDTMIAPVFEIGDHNEVLYENNFQSNIFFTYLGFMLFLFIYNVFLSISYKHISNYYHTAYVILVILSMAYVKGHLNEMIHSNWLMYHHHIITGLITFLLIQSIDKFTESSKNFHLLRYTKNAIFCANTFAILLIIFDFVRIGNSLMTKTIFVGAIWGIAVGVTSLKDGTLSSKLIVFGFSSFIIGSVTHLLRVNNNLPDLWGFNNAYILGSGLEVLCISFSFAIKINELKKKKYLDQVQITQLAQKNTELISDQNSILEKRVRERTEKLYEAYDEIQATLNTVYQQKVEIESTSEKIKESIDYAQRIQNALLPNISDLKKFNISADVFYQPKDTLSGDFYWTGVENNKLIIAVADCTGHGVPGAMMSITGHHLLNKIVHQDKVTVVNNILTSLHVELIKLLKAHETQTEEGMDIQLIAIDLTTKKIEFSGARNNLYFLDTSNTLTKIKADKTSIGGTHTLSKPLFTVHKISEDWDNIYLFSDGFQDQFNEFDKKFLVRRMKETFKNIHSLSPPQQIDSLATTFFEWKGEAPQIDDVLVMTIKKLTEAP